MIHLNIYKSPAVGLLISFLIATFSFAEDVAIQASGATFPFPIISKWAYQFRKETGITINYLPVGSGIGIANIKTGTTDFSVTDEPLQPNELHQDGLMQFPLIIGGIVPVYTIPDVTIPIRLTGSVLAEIFLGAITTWNDSAIQNLNPDIKLPDVDIVVVHRSDSSGSTWIFTNYLDTISSRWHELVGTGKIVAWPAGIGAKGNHGIAETIKKVKGSIGYVEFAYALQSDLSYALLQNHDGNFLLPTMHSFQAAATNKNCNATQNAYLTLIDQPGTNSWPITGTSFVLINKNYITDSKLTILSKFFTWCFTKGDQWAQELDYAPIPDSISDYIIHQFPQKPENIGYQ